jgi:hypothetical protein
VPLDAAILLLFEHRIAGQLGTVVADHHARIATLIRDGIKFGGDA